MLKFVRITIPTPMAIRLAEATDPRTCADQGYIVKSALAEAFADGAVRPWRIIGYDSDLIDIIGFAGGADVSSNAKSRKIGINVEEIHFSVDEGEVVQLTIQAAAIRAIKLGEDRKSRKYVDVGAVRAQYGSPYEPTPRNERGARWNAWLIDKLAGDTGINVIDIPEAPSACEISRMRKIGGGVRPFDVPVIDSKLTVRVTDPIAFRSTLAHGISKFKDVGLGSIIPSEILEDAA